MKKLILIVIPFLLFGLACGPSAPDDTGPDPISEPIPLFDGNYVQGRVFATSKKNEIGLMSIDLSINISKLIFFKGDKNPTNDYNKNVYFTIIEKDSTLWATNMVTLTSNIPKGKEVWKKKKIIKHFPEYGFADYHNIEGEHHRSNKHRTGHINGAFRGANGNPPHTINIAIIGPNGLSSEDSQVYYTDDESILDSALVLMNYEAAWIKYETRGGRHYLIEVSNCHNHNGQGLYCFQPKTSN